MACWVAFVAEKSELQTSDLEQITETLTSYNHILAKDNKIPNTSTHPITKKKKHCLQIPDKNYEDINP